MKICSWIMPETLKFCNPGERKTIRHKGRASAYYLGKFVHLKEGYIPGY